MTDFQSALADFMADTDVESLRQTALESTGVDICGVYCLHTGRKVGTFDDFVIQFAIDEESTEDEEELIDALIARVVASMRPTPMLNRPDRVTLLNLAAKHPIDILCYLANRLLSNRYMATTRNTDILDPYIARITLHSRWTDLHNSGVDLRPWIHWLLELDAKRNLHDVSPPQIALDSNNRWHLSAEGVSLFHLVTESNAAQLLEVFEKWTFNRLGEYDERDKQAEAQARWMRGNSMSQTAFTRSWLENPEIAQRKHAEAVKRRNKKSANPKATTSKAKKADKQMNQFMNLLDDVLEGKIEAPTPKKGPKLLTGAMLFAKKKES